MLKTSWGLLLSFHPHLLDSFGNILHRLEKKLWKLFLTHFSWYWRLAFVFFIFCIIKPSTSINIPLLLVCKRFLFFRWHRCSAPQAEPILCSDTIVIFQNRKNKNIEHKIGKCSKHQHIKYMSRSLSHFIRYNIRNEVQELKEETLKLGKTSPKWPKTLRNETLLRHKLLEDYECAILLEINTDGNNECVDMLIGCSEDARIRYVGFLAQFQDNPERVSVNDNNEKCSPRAELHSATG